MAFPSNPSLNELYPTTVDPGERQWIWNGYAWDTVSGASGVYVGTTELQFNNSPTPQHLTGILSIDGLAASATELATARTINGTAFNGTANITTANWGTGRTLTIGATGKSVNGSANVSWSLAEIGAASTAQAALADTAVQPDQLATVATTGSYTDLINKPTIPAAQVNSDWNATSGVAQILNKPTTLAGYGITDALNAGLLAVADGVASLDSAGKIPATQLPAIVLTDTFVVASELDQLALVVEQGDVAVRTDLSKSFIQNGGTAGDMTDWTELLSPTGGGVSSVAMSVPTGLNVSGSPITSTGTLAVSYAAGYTGFTSAEATKLANIAANATVGADWSTNLTGIPANITAWAGIAPSNKVNIAGDTMTGALGIGVAPTTMLDVQSTNFLQMRLGSAATTQKLFAGAVHDTVGSFIANNAHYNSSNQYMPIVGNGGVDGKGASGIMFDQNAGIRLWSNTNITTGTAFLPTERLSILTSGNIGIGETNPQNPLVINQRNQTNVYALSIKNVGPGVTGIQIANTAGGWLTLGGQTGSAYQIAATNRTIEYAALGGAYDAAPQSHLFLHDTPGKKVMVVRGTTSQSDSIFEVQNNSAQSLLSVSGWNNQTYIKAFLTVGEYLSSSAITVKGANPEIVLDGDLNSYYPTLTFKGTDGVTGGQFKGNIMGYGGLLYTSVEGHGFRREGGQAESTPLPIAMIYSSKNSTSLYLGDVNNNTSAYGVNDASATIRFNGIGVGQGDVAYYPNGTTSGHFRFMKNGTSVGSPINSTPNATVGVGSLYSATSITAIGNITGANLSGTNTGDQTITLTGAVTGSGTSSFSTTLSTGVVANTNLANVATATIKGRVSASTGVVEDLTAAQVRTLLNVADGATANTGTVTSVAASVPAGFNIAGSPITASGTLAITYASGYQGFTTAESNTIANISSTYIPLAQKGAANGVATLDANQKIPQNQLPAVAITDTFVVANQTAMLALTAEVGDVAVRSDISKSFILRVEPASTLGNWQELLTPATGVTSVAMSVPTGFNLAGSPITSTGTLAVTYASGYQGYTSSEATKLSGIAAGATVGADWNTNLSNIPANIIGWAGYAPENKVNSGYAFNDAFTSPIPVWNNLIYDLNNLLSGNKTLANHLALNVPPMYSGATYYYVESRATFVPSTSVQIAHSYNATSPEMLMRHYATEWSPWVRFWNSGNFANGDASQYIRGDGSLATLDYAAIGGTVPTWNQNTTGSAATLTTPRTLTIGSTGKTFNGGANVSWSLAEIGALPLTGGTLTGAVTGTTAEFTTVKMRLPSIVANANTTFSTTHLNCIVKKNNTTAYTYTIPSALGTDDDTITVFNAGSSNDITVVGSSVTLYENGLIVSNVIVKPYTSVTFLRAASGIWVV